MTREETYGAIMGIVTPGLAKVVGVIDVTGIVNGIIIAAFGACVGAVVGFFTKRFLAKKFKK